MAQYTDSELATELSKMLDSGCMTYPNPVMTEIVKRKKMFLESSNDLFILNSGAGETPIKFENEILMKLKYKATIKKVHLYPVSASSESDPVFDFSRFSEMIHRHLPKAEHLHIMHMRLKNFKVKGIPQLRSMHLVDPQCQDEEWNIELPELRKLVLQNHTPPVKNFGQSLIKCPKIEEFFAHKYWHEENLPKLYLPNCKKFTFRRGDCTSRLSLYIPRVEEFNLDANYSLSNITLLKKGHKEHKQWNMASVETHSKFTLSYRNADLGVAARRTLIKSGRLIPESETKSSRKRKRSTMS